jgi:hypothetical protein
MKSLASSVLILLFLTVATARAQEDDPAGWIKQLGSDREDVRAAAETALERRGREVLPLLRVATDARDPVIRARALALIERIQAALLARPTMVTLDFHDRPVAEVVETIQRRSGLALELFPKDSPVWPQRRVTLHQEEPVPFLEAVDRLCEAGGLHLNFWQSEEERGREPAFRLVDGREERAPVSYSGAFRVALLSIHDHHDLSFESEFPARFDPRSPVRLPRKPPRAQLYVRLKVTAEPRMSIRLDRPLRWTEAVDDQGQSLMPLAGDQVGDGRGVAELTPSQIIFSVPLKHPVRRGTAIRRLLGVVSVMGSTRAPEPLTLSLKDKDAVGRKVEGRGAALEVREIRESPGRPWEMKLFVRTEDPRENTGLPSTWLQNSQFELVDGRGQPSRALFSYAYVEKDLKAVTFRLLEGERAALPVELRYYSLTRATAEVPFEFTDIEMP